jgi:hypothetical protein
VAHGTILEAPAAENAEVTMTEKAPDADEWIEIRYGAFSGRHQIDPYLRQIPKNDGKARSDVKENIRTFGQKEAAVFLGARLLDGRSRIEIANELGREPLIVQFSNLGTGMTPEDWIEMKNLHRRNLTEDQRIMTLAKLRALRKEQEARRRFVAVIVGGKGVEFIERASGCVARAKDENGPPLEYPQKPADIPKPGPGRPKGRRSEAEELAAAAKVSRYAAEQALKVRDEAPQLAEAVQHGDLKMRHAAHLVEQQKAKPPATQAETTFDPQARWQKIDDMLEKEHATWPEEHHPFLTEKLSQVVARWKRSSTSPTGAAPCSIREEEAASASCAVDSSTEAVKSRPQCWPREVVFCAKTTRRSVNAMSTE